MMKQKRGNPHLSLSRKSSMPAQLRLFQKYLVESPIYLMTQREGGAAGRRHRGGKWFFGIVKINKHVWAYSWQHKTTQ